MIEVLLQTSLPGLKLLNRGKVRDIYDISADQLLIVASDRISAFDSVLASGIPLKGKVLNSLSEFWFRYTADVVPNHLITTDVDAMGPAIKAHAAQLRGRSMLVKKTQVVPIECVVRGYLAGSGWKEYRQSGSVCGIKLPKGLRECDKLPKPLFTPATKAATGHDENITFARAAKIAGRKLAAALRDQSLAIYQKASDYAAQKGIIISDTKFEWGMIGEQLLVIDEMLTPDSSRFWPADQYKPGQSQPSFDKQFV
ncbi:MAG: phosphoribosylaminoimidazolesuccinocarboxamide synthase, partial [Planctomycetes bacterium]|nr:phosphoribosylaminoimidazolesuccinocarboxamide synthase [Planctomycetota bacterium]